MIRWPTSETETRSHQIRNLKKEKRVASGRVSLVEVSRLLPSFDRVCHRLIEFHRHFKSLQVYVFNVELNQGIWQKTTVLLSFFRFSFSCVVMGSLFRVHYFLAILRFY